MEHHLHLGTDVGGVSLRQHLLNFATREASARVDLVGPPLPALAHDAWRAFTDLQETRGMGQHGPSPITYAEMVAYQALTDTRLTPLDVMLVREADAAFLRESYARLKQAQG